MAIYIDLISALLDETNDIVFLIDEDSRICGYSRVAQAIFGLKPQGSRGPSLTALLSESDDGSLMKSLARLRRTGKKASVESSLRLSDGEALRVRLSLRDLATKGNINGHERSRVLAIGSRLDSSSEGGDSSRFGPLVERVLGGYGDPVLLLDMARRTILRCNEPALVAFGWKREELVGASIEMLAEGGSFTDDFLGVSRLAYATAGVLQTRLSIKRKDGGSLACECTNIALFDERGLIESVLCILHDRSYEERRKAELRQLIAEAAALSSRLESAASKFLDPASRPRLSECGFSRRHIEIIGRVASGLTMKEIARELGLAEATVKSHLSTIYKKLEVRSRTELLRHIHDKGYRID
jgi:PAS domain S-box-containing protein